MPTTLVLYYTASVTVTVPNKIARKLKEQEGVQSCENAAWAFGNKWGALYYQGEDGKEHKIEGDVADCDYKRTEQGEWWDEEESEDEEGDQCEECYTKAATKCEMCGNSLCHYHTRGKDKESADLCKGCFGKEEEESK